MSALLRTRQATTEAMLAVFDDTATLRHALAFEAGLARAEAAAVFEDSAAKRSPPGANGAAHSDGR